jgi:hypothetical protein
VILSPIDSSALPSLLAVFAERLRDPGPRSIFGRIARSGRERAMGAAAAAHHRAALTVAAAHGMPAIPGPPAADFSWNGTALRSTTEAYVLIHEVAHFQLAAPARRHRIDFGLGPGPETGDRVAAERAACLFGAAREAEERLASLLGIIWEAELGHPALASFLDQNWLEAAARPSTADYFAQTVRQLSEDGFLGEDGRPRPRLRDRPD